jgi:hypothetical protein
MANQSPKTQIPSQSPSEFKKYTVEMVVVTRLYAPHLSSVEFIKKKEIKEIIECYKKDSDLSEEDLESLTHLDRGFPRDIMCRPYLSVAPVSGALREIAPDAIVRGDPIILPKDRIAIEVKTTPKYRMMSEYLEPVRLQFTAIARLPKDLENKPLQLKIGGGSAKGYGLTIVTFKPEQ